MQPLFEHNLELAGFRTRALEIEGDGPPLLFLHGYADSADTWRLALDLLARRGRRAVALDMPGFGAAQPLRKDEPVLDQLGAFAAAAVEHVAGEGGDVVLCGNSLGGCVSLRASENPELPIAAVVPVAPAGFDHPAWFRVIEANILVRGLLASPLPIPEAVVRGVVGQAYRTLAFAQPRDVNGEVVASFTSHFRTRDLVSARLATGRRVLMELSDCFSLDKVEAPVLLIWGDRDRMVTHNGSRHVLEALPDTSYVLFDGVGHCPQIEAPERFVDALEDFVSEVAMRGRSAGSD